MITYLKLGGILAAIALIFVIGFRFGGMGPKAKLEGFQATQAENTAKAVLAERASAATELARVNTILRGYQDAPIDPISTGLAHRVFVYANAAGCSVSKTGANPAAVGGAGPVPHGDPELERLSQAAFDAGTHDAKELTALQAAYPR